MQLLTTALSSPDTLLDHIIASTLADGIDLRDYIIDHICYRVPTLLDYERVSKILDTLATCLGEIMIAGRPIRTYLLNTPYIYNEWTIECVELPAPKSGSDYKEGWEHAEIATGMHPKEFIRLHPDLAFETGAISKSLNPEVALRYGEYCTKFHEFSLRYVVEVLEKDLPNR